MSSTVGLELDRCRSCGAPIVWAATLRGRSMPVDAEPSPAGNVRLVGSGFAAVLRGDELVDARAAGEELRTSHFATCRDTERWRRAR